MKKVLLLEVLVARSLLEMRFLISVKGLIIKNNSQYLLFIEQVIMSRVTSLQ